MYLVTVTNVKERKKIERRRELNYELYDCSCCLIASASSRATNLSTKLLFFSLLFPQSGEKMTSNSLESSLRFTYQRIRVRDRLDSKLIFSFYRQFSLDSSGMASSINSNRSFEDARLNILRIRAKKSFFPFNLRN